VAFVVVSALGTLAFGVNGAAEHRGMLADSSLRVAPPGAASAEPAPAERGGSEAPVGIQDSPVQIAPELGDAGVLLACCAGPDGSCGIYGGSGCPGGSTPTNCPCPLVKH
jgi:hypothetical protein